MSSSIACNLQVDKLQSLKELILNKDVQLLQVMCCNVLLRPAARLNWGLQRYASALHSCWLTGLETRCASQVFLPELVVLQADPAPSVRKFLPEFLEACPPAALHAASLPLVLQCLQGLLQDSVPAVVKAAVMASSSLLRTTLAVVIGRVSLIPSCCHTSGI